MLDWLLAALLAAATFGLYRLTAGAHANHQSGDPQFVLLASAFLQHRLWLDPAGAARLGDITAWTGRYYVSFPPMPAVLLMPFVAYAGTTFNDVVFSMALGSVNVALMYLTVRRLTWPGFAVRQPITIGRVAALASATLFGFGTVHFGSALQGSVWYLAHIVYDFFLLLYLRECAGAGRPLVAGLALAGAFLTRPTAVFGGLFWLVLALGQVESPSALAKQVAKLAAPGVVALVLLLWQNLLRFGSPVDFGYFKMNVAGTLAPRLRTYGQFSTHFLNDNIHALLLSGPVVDGNALGPWLRTLPGAGGLGGLWQAFTQRPGQRFPLSWDPWGAGFWAVSPALVAVFRPPERALLLLTGAAWASIIAIAIPDLLYYNTGWGQFGDRFALDFLPFLVLLVAIGLRQPLARWWATLVALLVVLSIASNWLGARWFLHLPPY